MKRLLVLAVSLFLLLPVLARPRIVKRCDTPYAATAAGILERFLGEAGYPGTVLLDQDASLPKDAFRISGKGKNVLLEGNGKGLVYAACDFLEQEMGMDYWGDGEYVLPRRKTVTLRPRTEIPAFRYRQTSHYCLRNGRVATSDNGVDKVRNADSLYRYWYRLEEPHDLFVDNLWVHTCNKLLLASRYGDAHPEYYAWFGGQRHPGSASQWCFTNPEVLEIVCERLDSLFKAHPEQTMISISQNDGTDTYCRCPECQAVMDEEGSPSGPILRFMNAVAERFPDKEISTLAYLFTMHPPKITRPRENVSIMLCDIDCRRQTSLRENPSGREFMECLEGWSTICDNLFLWDYGINFDNYLSPFPNLQTIKDNMVIFEENGVKMHFSQINSSLGGDMAELRPYLVSKLMWNPKADLDSLERHFCESYYGAAAPYILHYIHEIEGAAVGTDVDLFIYDSPVSYKNNILRPELMRRYNALFDAAEDAVAGDPLRLLRVQRTRLPLRYSALEIARTNPDRDVEAVEKDLELFESQIREMGITSLNERNNSPLDYCAMYRERYLSSPKGNLAYRKPVSYVIAPHKRYESLSGASLTDGLYGGTSYVENWVGWEGTDADFTVDLGESQTVRCAGVDFLRQIGGWVLEPRGIHVYVSDNGTDFVPFASIENPESRNETIGFKALEVKGEAEARYVRFVVEGVRICPEWHYGVGNPCWFFIDEIWVR